MSKVADGPFVEVRERKPNEHGKKDGCHCGLPFVCVAVAKSGDKRFFWCVRCDVVGRK